MNFEESFRENIRNRRGFTLVEMIVVLVIMGILLTILVPGMFQYIDKAKDKQLVINARTAYLAVQTQLSEEYGKEGATLESAAAAVVLAVNGQTAGGTGGIVGLKETDIDQDGKIIGMTYTENGKRLTLSDGIWSEPLKAEEEP